MQSQLNNIACMIWHVFNIVQRGKRIGLAECCNRSLNHTYINQRSKTKGNASNHCY